MAKEPNRVALLQGTLDMLILRTLLFGARRGHRITKHIQRTSHDMLQADHGSLYPALHRLEPQAWMAAKGRSTDCGGEMKFYRLTAAGRKQFLVETSRWKQRASALARVMRPA
jgi:PadR family transcriptional regulator PadR